MKAGGIVLTQKPLALNAEEARHMLAAAQKHKDKVGSHLRRLPEPGVPLALCWPVCPWWC